MSRIGNIPVKVPSGVEIAIDKKQISVQGPKGNLQFLLDGSVSVSQDTDVGELSFKRSDNSAHSAAMVGTTRSIVNNMVYGVSVGFERRLELNGVGYRASLQNKVLNLALGFSRPVLYTLPESVQAEVPSQTEIILRGSDKALLGRTAATIRAFRPPEPYKGKGVRHKGEYVRRKETKKKK